MMTTPTRRAALATTAAALLVGPFAAGADAAEEKPQPMKRVPEVLDVQVSFTRTRPAGMVVRVKGEVPTGGWTDAQLLRRIYLKTPEDGMWEYDLIARPPSGIATQVITPVTAVDTWLGFHNAVRGVRVYGDGISYKEVKIPVP